ATIAPLEAYAFSGDWRTRGAPVGGPVADFNVVTQRGVVDAAVSALRPSRALTMALATTTLVYLVAGRAELVAPGGRIALTEDGAVIAELGAGPCPAVVLAQRGAVLIRVRSEERRVG